MLVKQTMLECELLECPQNSVQKTAQTESFDSASQQLLPPRASLYRWWVLGKQLIVS